MLRRLVSCCLCWVSAVGFLVSGVTAEEVVKRAEALQPGNAKDGTLKIKGYVQGRYESFEAANTPDTFKLKSAYLTAYGTVSPDWGYEIEADVSGAAPIVRNAYLVYTSCPHSKIRFGQQKVSFSEEYWTSSAALDTIERSLPVTKLSAERDTGVNILADFWQEKINLGLGVFNGTGIGGTDTNDRKDVIGRVVVSPFKGSKGALDGLTLGFGAWGGKQVPTATATGVRNRYSGLVVYKFRLLKLQGEYLFQKLGQKTSEDKKGQGSYLLCTGDLKKDVLQLVAKTEIYDPDNTAEKDTQIISTYGVNYFVGSNTRLMVNYRILDEDSKVDNNELLAQLQIKF